MRKRSYLLQDYMNCFWWNPADRSKGIVTGFVVIKVFCSVNIEYINYRKQRKNIYATPHL